MVVISERDSLIGGALSDFRNYLAQPFIVRRCDGAVLRAFVRNLEVEPSHIMHKFCMGRVLGNFFGFERGVNTYAPAGERNHLQLVLFEQVPQFRGAAKFFEHIGPQLNSMEAQRRNVFDRLPVVSVPSDGRISKQNVGRRGRNRRIKIRQVHRRVERRIQRCIDWDRGKSSRSRHYPEATEKLTTRSAKHHTGSSVAANGASDLAKANIVARVCGWLTELRSVGYAECLGAFSAALLTVTVRNRTGRSSQSSDSHRQHP